MDKDTGDLIYELTDSKENFGVTYDDGISKAIEDAVKDKRKIVAIHNHPNGMPPSLDDDASAFAHGYDTGVVIGHNLEVWSYGKTKESVSSDVCTAVHKAISDSLAFDVELDEELWYND